MVSRLPKIVHQVWIGPAKRPDVWMDTVRDFCAEFGYEHRIWSEDTINTLEPPLANRAQYDSVPQLCGKVDIARYGILHRFGGVYLDADTVVVNPAGFHALIAGFNADFGCGIEPNTTHLANGVMLAPANSTFLAECIRVVPLRNLRDVAWKATGPRLITDVHEANKSRFAVVIYPPHVFYPRAWHGIYTTDLHKSMVFEPENLLFQYGYSTNNLASKI